VEPFLENTFVARILLIEDEVINQKIVSACLAEHEISISGSLESARTTLLQQTFDLILLDVKLPDGDGFSFLLELQSQVMEDGVPVILLTGKTEAADKVTGYSLGADDYITKPLDPIVFKARIESKLRKRGSQKSNQSSFKKDGFTFSLEKQSVTYEVGGRAEAIDLTTLEFKIFLYLIKHKDHVFSREQLIQAVWKDSVNISDRTIDSHLSHLRKRLVKSSLTIQAVYGAGYKLTDARKTA
jgi:DNA-binding response OmpR family regulator